MAGGVDDGTTYTRSTAGIYIFNLVVGIGALALPYGFQQAGIVLGVLFLVCCGMLAFITTTYIIEAQSASNYLLASEYHADDSPLINSSSSDDDGVRSSPDSESLPFISQHDQRFNIKKRTEVGFMTQQFLDLAIYAATVPTSLSVVTGGFSMGKLDLSAHDVYYFYLALFALFVVIILTSYKQSFRMIILSIIFIAQGKGAPPKDLPMFNFAGLPAMFGVSIYAFMCHHSLPSIITPISTKKRLTFLMGIDFGSIFVAYALLCITAVIAFGNQTNPTCDSSNHSGTFIPCEIQSLYIYNFSSYNIKVFAIFLSLFPVFTLSTNYVLISITLRNNLLNLITYKSDQMNPKIRNIVFSLVSSLLPVGIAFATRNVSFLVNITGGYAGLGIIFVMPVALSYYSNKKLNSLGVTTPYRSLVLSPSV
ncbi:transmembrane protein [Heterostelium album PN500]|uniref:Transmembrane protein n=1 Tax=Heterostelium pallidum (strain ATCC 26659 / Pp 5 / PN500) TaxID=670386 RepID=D3AX96_HETP5|nr:transmembrane protein [Heterostelium album PN500]EFA86165.1 transmembrane protein [Heterostelium album PN500]|eukprot:XP_020438270.1 transmembrane protein [Heterostelium album PN500]